MQLKDDFFKPQNSNKFHSVQEMDENRFRSAIVSYFFNNPDILSFGKLKDLHDLLVDYFKPTTEEYFPLTNKERFCILLAIAKNPESERETILKRAQTLSLERMSKDIVEALCIEYYPGNDDSFSSVVKSAYEIKPITDSKVRNLIYDAISKIEGVENRKIMAQYFVDSNEKEKLANAIIIAMKKTGKFVMQTSTGTSLVFKASISNSTIKNNTPIFSL